MVSDWPDLNSNSLCPKTIILKLPLCCMEMRLDLNECVRSAYKQREREWEREQQGRKRRGGDYEKQSRWLSEKWEKRKSEFQLLLSSILSPKPRVSAWLIYKTVAGFPGIFTIFNMVWGSTHTLPHSKGIRALDPMVMYPSTSPDPPRDSELLEGRDWLPHSHL